MSGHLTDHSSLASDGKVLALCPPNRPLFPDTLPLRSEQHFLYALKIVRSLAFYETKQNKTKPNWQLCPSIPMQKCGCRLDKHSSDGASLEGGSDVVACADYGQLVAMWGSCSLHRADSEF